MAAPQRWRSALPTEPAWPAREPQGRPAVRRASGRKARGQKRRFAVLVLIPVLLMLGSIYLHTVSADLQSRAAVLQQEFDAARAEGERLEVDVAELSAADRVRSLAREKLGMRDAGSTDLEVYRGNQREDGKDAGQEKGGGQP